MDFSYVLNDGMTIYECSRQSNIPYSTVSDIIKGKTPIDKVSMRTAYYMSKTLGVTMDELYEQMHVPERINFELFKSNTCHRLKEQGDIKFVLDTLETKRIRRMYGWEWFPESFYLLAMLDYISKLNGISLCNEYDDIREKKLRDIIYPASIIAMSIAMNDETIKEKAVAAAIPEFLKYNIVESEVRNVI